MKIVYYSSIYFTDCDFPLVKQYQTKGVDVLYFVEVITNRYKGGLFNIKSKIPSHGIIPASSIPEFQVYSKYIDLNNVFVYVRTSNILNITNWCYQLILCLKILKFHASIVHITQVLGLSECLLYIFKRKIVLTVHDPFPHSGEKKKTFEIKRKIAFNLVPRIVLLNEKQKKEFGSFYHVENKICLNRLSIYECLNFLTNTNQVNPYGRYLLFFGHFSPYKGIDVLCEAMKIVIKSNPEISCVIAGRGNLNFDFKKYEKIKQIILLNQFVELDDLANLIFNSDFVVCPYKDATQSGVVFSAFAISKPVLATNVGGLSESVIDNVTGKLVEPNNVDELAKCIIYMCNHHDMVNKMSDNIHSIYNRGSNSWARIADDYIKIYKQIDER